jgi:hypothetical protein
MSDYFDAIEQELRLAVRRRAHLPLHARLRLRHSRALLIACACVVVGGPAIAAAAGAFRSGPPVPATVPATPRAFDGVAIARSVHVLALRVADPGGGPPWGLRVSATTRGLLCVQPGRVVDGQVGVLGIDDAFANDHRFHPFSDDYVDTFGCAGIDGAGHAFVAPTVIGAAASALAQSCVPAYLPRGAGAAPHGKPAGRGPICPPGAVREISYGMLGPDAVSYSYTDASGRLVSTPTAGPDGAFLIVRATPTRCVRANFCAGTLIGADPAPGELIRKVTYRSGETCSLPAHFTAAHHAEHCPSVGYVAPPAQHITEAQVATAVAVRNLGLQHFCRRTPGETPCGTNPPAGARVLPGPVNYIIDVSFTARVAVHNVNSSYEVVLHYPRVEHAGCPIAGVGGPTDNDLAAGQRVVVQEYVRAACTGTFQIHVSFRQPRRKPLRVGAATFALPPR